MTTFTWKVANVDAVGIATARAGLRVTGGGLHVMVVPVSSSLLTQPLDA